MSPMRCLVPIICVLTAWAGTPGAACAQRASGRVWPAPVTFTARQDHRNMMEQLGIQQLWPGGSRSENSPRHANYDEALADPYGPLPHALRFPGGHPVRSARAWWLRRRPELVADFERDVYGRIPKDVPHVTWTVVACGRGTLGGYAIAFRRLIGVVDNSAYPLIRVKIPVTLVLPAAPRRKVPVLILFTAGVPPVPRTEPERHELALLNAALRTALGRYSPSARAVLRRHPRAALITGSMSSLRARTVDGGAPPIVQLIAAGWGFATLDPTAAQPDSGAGLTRGIIGLTDHGQPRTPGEWGTLRAWAWAASQTLAELGTDPDVNAHAIGIEGVSRFGTAALVTLAFDPRFALGLIGSSGKGGATPLRRNYGATVGNLAGTGKFQWMAGNFLRYDAAVAAFGSRNPGELPVDSNELIALCAPRLVFISYGMPTLGSTRWLDPRGGFMATVAASRVYRLLGVPGLVGAAGTVRHVHMPAINHGLLAGRLAWREDDGGRSDAPNMKYFIAWADHFLHYHNPQPKVLER